MADTNTNEMIIQPNPYAGGIPRRPLCYPNAKKYPQGSGGTPPNSGLGPGQNSITMDNDVSLSGPGTQLNGTQQKTEPLPGGPVRPLNPGTDLVGAVTGSTPVKNNPGGSGTASGNSTGWRQSGADWYYFDTSTREMAKGWKLIENKWYYFNQNGIMQKDWLLLGNKWYYLDVNNGAMDTGWLLNNGDHYYLDADGHMLTGWQQLDGAWYYFYPPNGKMTYGDWLEIGGKWYYFHPDGKMAASEIAVYKPNGQKYYLGESGAMITSDDAEQVTYRGVTYSVDEKGVCTAISVPRPADADREKWKVFIANDQSLSETRKTIVLEGIRIVEQGCIYHQLRKNAGTPDKCLVECDHQKSERQVGEYNFSTMANYNLEDPLYLDCSFFVKHCYWKAGLEMGSGDTEGMYTEGEFKKIAVEKMTPGDIAVRFEKHYEKDGLHRNGHVTLFVGCTSGNAMVWVEMSNHNQDGKFSSYTPDSRFKHKHFIFLT